MKHYIGIFVISSMLFLYSISMVSAQESLMNGEELLIASPTPTLSITAPPDYTLPYPGLLPDHPLYGIKALRDRFVSFMIGEPAKKAEFNLLQADKRVGAAIMLITTKKAEKYPLAISTISKGLNYYEEALEQVNEAKRQGTDMNEMITRMKKASMQHRYLLDQAKKQTPDTIDKELDMLIQRSQQLRSRLPQVNG